MSVLRHRVFITHAEIGGGGQAYLVGLFNVRQGGGGLTKRGLAVDESPPSLHDRSNVRLSNNNKANILGYVGPMLGFGAQEV